MVKASRVGKTIAIAAALISGVAGEAIAQNPTILQLTEQYQIEELKLQQIGVRLKTARTLNSCLIRGADDVVNAWCDMLRAGEEEQAAHVRREYRYQELRRNQALTLLEFEKQRQTAIQMDAIAQQQRQSQQPEPSFRPSIAPAIPQPPRNQPVVRRPIVVAQQPQPVSTPKPSQTPVVQQPEPSNPVPIALLVIGVGMVAVGGYKAAKSFK